LPQDTTAFTQLVGTYWAQQECEVLPACILQPPNAQDLSTGVGILKRHFDEQRKKSLEGDEGLDGEGLFAVRCGGHHHVAGAASIRGGVLVDLSRLNKVKIAEDGKTMTFGAGLRWKQVFKELDKRGLAAVGARNSDVGVGGFVTGGKRVVCLYA
jgi:FAD/FMN-containing dehydrogenase